MCHKKIRIPRENATEILRALGTQENSIEFIDLNKNDVEAKKNFSSMLKRCEEMTSKIQEFEVICEEYKIQTSKYNKYTLFYSDLNQDLSKRDKKYGATYFDLIETEIIENDKKIKELVNSHSQIREDLVSLIEKRHVLTKTSQLITDNLQLRQSFAEGESFDDGIKTSSNLHFIAGVVSINEELKMKRMIFRVSRGRAIATFYNMALNEDEKMFTASTRQRGFSLADKKRAPMPLTYDINNSKKKIFNIIFQGGEENVLLGKILKICEIFQTSRYSVPNKNDLTRTIMDIERDINDKKELLITIEKNLTDIITKAVQLRQGHNCKYELYKLYFLQEKMIYATLNKCLLHGTFIDGEVWIPKRKVAHITRVLQTVYSEQDNKLSANLQDIDDSTDVVPPTFIPTNDFLFPFQMIVDTYGIPRYQEVNPAYFAIVTFPFEFGIMFGDIGHGFIVFLFALYLCICKSSIEKSNSMIKNVLSVRYFLLLMGFFACYCGWLYNDFLSVPIQMYTCYEEKEGQMIKKDGCVYNFGVDPKWMGATNELSFINSLKMKLSVIIGVLHMTFGIILKGCNAIYFKRYTEFIFSFIPQIIFMLGLFGYMDGLIIVKWLHNFSGKESTAPDIKSLLLNIFLKFGSEIENSLYGGKDLMRYIHIGIAILSFICIIIMLVPKTLLDYSHEKKNYQKKINNNNNNNQELLLDHPHKQIEAPKFSDVFVHVIIETIEFVLGTVSNTASYLRLWALSLAHSQLSHVFFEYGVLKVVEMDQHWIIKSFMLSVSFIAFSFLTLGVLLFMDLMECFLHTLRLHWVEFQDKFFKADGYKFSPFNFESLIVAN